MGAVGVVAAGLVTVETSRIDSGMAIAFLGASAEKRYVFVGVRANHVRRTVQ